jgi:hypothetical protein
MLKPKDPHKEKAATDMPQRLQEASVQGPLIIA